MPTPNSNPYVDPQNAQLEQDFASILGGKDITKLPLKEVRELLDEIQVHTPSPNVTVQRFLVPTSHGKVKTFLFKPRHSAGPLRFIYMVHGGGWIAGDKFFYERFVDELVTRTGLAVVFPQYTLAPDEQFPAQHEQCFEVLQYMAKNGHGKGLKTDKVAVVGDSAGGQLATAISILAKQRKLSIPIVHQILISPVTDLTSLTDTFSEFEFQDGPFLTRALLTECFNDYIPKASDRKTILASPVLMSPQQAAQYMPATTILTSSADFLRDEGKNLAKLLQQAGVPCGSLQLFASLHDAVLNGAASSSPTSQLALGVIVSKLVEVLGEDGEEHETENGNGEKVSPAKRKRTA